MILKKASAVEITPTYDGTKEAVHKHVEKCGRVCYKSEDKITDTSADKFVNMLIDRKHTAMVEHGTLYLVVDLWNMDEESADNICRFFYSNNYSSVFDPNRFPLSYIYITTNMRVLEDNPEIKELLSQYHIPLYDPPTKYHEKRRTFLITTDRAICMELVRHRVFSFAMESSRYCLYSKDKFSKQITYIIPNWLNMPEGEYRVYEDNYLIDTPNGPVILKDVDSKFGVGALKWLLSMHYAEYSYMTAPASWTPQMSRSMLPNSTKADIIMTGTEEQWEAFFKLRCDKAAHPQIREVADIIKNILEKGE